MSVFIHRCGECGHNHWEHQEGHYKGRACSHTWCECSQVLAQVLESPPELIPQFAAFTLEQIETVYAPGTVLGSPMHKISACSCTACREAYDSLVSA